MIVLKILVAGVIILLGALLLNVIATQLSLTTWYDFLKDPRKANTVSLLWLFLIYPFGLGLLTLLATRLLKF
jgi:hypothetical protein